MVNDLIDSQVEETSLGLTRLHRILDELPPERLFNRLGLELRIRQLYSILDWLERCRAVIKRQNNYLQTEHT